MVAYHFPPLAGSSGIQRTLRFVQHLPAFGWQPLVLTAATRAYERTSPDLEAEVPRDAIVRRAFAVDTTRHLSIAGRHFAWMARPDRWASWRFDGVRQGLRMIAELKPDVIFSTYPIATAHTIAADLHRRSGLPWVADFRDPMAQDGYPSDPKTFAAFERIEEEAVRLARLCLFTTPGSARSYRERYPSAADRIVVLENGFDEEAFAAAEARPSTSRPTDGPRIFLHSGIVYPSERDPQHLLQALRHLHDRMGITPRDLRVRFRAAVHDEMIRSLAARYGVGDYIELCPPLGYADALREMLDADALLLMQASNCNAQIPAKLYEYLRAGRPIVALTDPTGDTAGALRQAGLHQIAPLDSPHEIADLIGSTLTDLGTGSFCLPAKPAVSQASRRGRAQALATLLDGSLE